MMTKYKKRIKQAMNKLKYITMIAILLLSITKIFPQNETAMTPLTVGEHWTKRVVTEENNAKRFYYRPHRFEYMEMQTQNLSEIQLRAVLTQKATQIEIFIKIGQTEQKHTIPVNRNDDYFYYAEPITINIPTTTETIHIRTRNPHAYFRHYTQRQRTLKPKNIRMIPETYFQRHILSSQRTNSEYFSANDENTIKYIADTDGDIYFFARSIREGRQTATIDIIVNNSLRQTTILPNKTSTDYKIGDARVSTGMRIEIKDIKRGDIIEIVPKTWHEIVTRMFITTKEVF